MRGVSGLFDNYPHAEGVYDEMFGDDGIRGTYRGVAAALQGLGDDEVRSRVEFLKTVYVDQGVTFDFSGEERPFPLDIVPRIVDAASWAHVEAGVKQRIKALDAFLDDVYTIGQCFTDGVIPRRVITSSPNFHRQAAGFRTPNGVRVHVSGVDLIRDAQGTFRVLEDNVRIPSGVSYVMTNRRAITSALPEAFSEYRVRPVRVYAERLLATLRAAAPSGISDPTVVVLTPGVYNSAYFEHSLLARMMGVELVEGRDLVCQNGQVWVRTTKGLQRVHVIYRRVDDDFLDPQAFRQDSMLGVAGLLSVARAGNVTIANAIGNGVADDKLVYTYVPDIIRYYLGEEPILDSVKTWRLDERAHRDEVIDRLDELVVKPVDGAGGKGIVIGPRASRAEIDAVRARILDDPRGWIAQPVVQLSTVPTMVEDGGRPRHVDLRPFALNSGDDVFVLPGGLTRVALAEGQLIVNSSQGGGSKDTWVLDDDGSSAAPAARQFDGMVHPVVQRQRSGSASQQMGGGSMTQTMGSMTQTMPPMGQALPGQTLGGGPR